MVTWTGKPKVLIVTLKLLVTQAWFHTSLHSEMCVCCMQLPQGALQQAFPYTTAFYHHFIHILLHFLHWHSKYGFCRHSSEHRKKAKSVANVKNVFKHLHQKDLCLAVCKGEGWWILMREDPSGSAGHLWGTEFHPQLELMPWKNIQMMKYQTLLGNVL